MITSCFYGTFEVGTHLFLRFVVWSGMIVKNVSKDIPIAKTLRNAPFLVGRVNECCKQFWCAQGDLYPLVNKSRTGLGKHSSLCSVQRSWFPFNKDTDWSVIMCTSKKPHTGISLRCPEIVCFLNLLQHLIRLYSICLSMHWLRWVSTEDIIVS